MTPAEVQAELIRRMSAKDLVGSLELIADDAVYFWSNGSAMFGKDAIAEGLKENFANIDNDTYEVSDVTWLVESADAAACVFKFAWTGEIEGRPVSGRGRGASVLRRTNAKWEVVHENLSSGVWSADERWRKRVDEVVHAQRDPRLIQQGL
jgi:ketosteroid isomerase-like protein